MFAARIATDRPSPNAMNTLALNPITSDFAIKDCVFDGKVFSDPSGEPQKTISITIPIPVLNYTLALVTAAA